VFFYMSSLQAGKWRTDRLRLIICTEVQEPMRRRFVRSSFELSSVLRAFGSFSKVASRSPATGCFCLLGTQTKLEVKDRVGC